MYDKDLEISGQVSPSVKVGDEFGGWLPYALSFDPKVLQMGNRSNYKAEKLTASWQRNYIIVAKFFPKIATHIQDLSLY